MTLRVLVSYHYHRNTDLADLVTKLGGDVDLFADSGAYSALTTGATIKLPDYAAWLRHWQPLFTVASTLDVIGDHHATADNTARLRDAGCDTMPVFHANEPWSVLERLCAAHRYVALGGVAKMMGATGSKSAAQKKLMTWLVKAFLIGRDHGTAFHGFGLTTAKLVRELPFYSVDSSSYTFGVRWGLVYLWDEQRLKIGDCKFRSPVERHQFRHLLRSHGLDLDRIGHPAFMRPGSPTVADDRASLAAASARAYRRMEHSLQRRHAVPAPSLPGHVVPGTKVYLSLAGAGLGDLAPFRLLLRPPEVS